MTKLSNLRIGNPTSSEIYKLCSNGRKEGEFGAPFYTYLEECRAERFLKQQLDGESEVLAFDWGKLCELHVHNILSTDYIMQSEESLCHAEINEWVGTPDGVKMSKGIITTVSETKCPLTKKSFYQLVKDLYDFDGLNVTKKETFDGNEIIRSIRKNHKDGEKYYWQIISNACILKSIYKLDTINAELIVFMPYIDELEELKSFNAGLDEPYGSIQWAKDGKLPFIYPDLGLENLNIIPFEIPKEDETFLKERVNAFLGLLNNK